MAVSHYRGTTLENQIGTIVENPPKIQQKILDAVRALDGREICGQRVRVEMRKTKRRIGSEHSEQKLR